MSVIDQVLAANRAFAQGYPLSHLSAHPTRRLAVLACMDSRQPMKLMLGLRPGDAHLLRNAGAVVTDDVLRSLLVSHHIKKTEALMVVAHTDCGLMGLDESAFCERLRAQTGASSNAPVAFHSFSSLQDHVREQVARVRAHPWLGGMEARGFVYDVGTGRLEEVPC